ncbi:hypothetical protein LOZ65_002720 [Ophidiomyces ophidiicola]|nr:hypothetical protein LOZ65_002720 [Ophidiomyces ophidiicola]
MEAVKGPGRMTSLSENNHQPWLWFVHMFALIFVFLAAVIRARIKRRHYGLEDTVLLISHILYLAYWIVLLVAILSSLGKSGEISSRVDIAKVSRLIFASRIVLTLVLCTVKLSSVLLIYNIFIKSVDPSCVSLYVIIGFIAAQGVVGPITISAGCSLDWIPLAGDKSACSNIVPRWIIFTTFETMLECAPVFRVVSRVLNLQVATKTKVFVIVAFLTRLIVLVPAWIHLVCYRRFLQHGSDNIGIVSTIISEELWASVALVSTSIPVLMRVAKKFSVSREIGETTARGSRSNKSRATKKTPNPSFEMASANGHGNWQPHKNQEASYLHRDNYSVAVFPRKLAPESITSTSESHVGILREIQVEISSLHIAKSGPRSPTVL